MAIGAQEIAEHEGAAKAPVGCRHLVVTVHGIRTFGEWQDRLEAIVGAACNRAGGNGSQPQTTIVKNYRYGYFSMIAFLIPMLRWIVTRRFREELKQAIQDHNPERIDIVAHSFGTHLAAWGLMGIPIRNRPTIHTIILAGSVLKIGFPWRLMLQDRKVYRVVNECGRRDCILLLNQFFVLFTGMAGRVGFIGMEDGERFVNRFYDFGHSGYFEGQSPETADEFMCTRWLPLLVGDDRLRKIDERTTLTALGGATTFFLNNAEPIKLAIYVTPLLLLALWINGLRRGAEAARQAAVTAKNDAVAARNEAVASKNRAIKLAHDNAELAVTEKMSRQRADQQSQLALATLKSVVFDIQTKLENVPAAEDVRQNLLNTALVGLEKVARGLDTAEQADNALVWSHLQLGDTFRLIGSGRPTSATDLARHEYEVARQTAQKLVQANPKNIDYQRGLLTSYDKLGDVSLQLGNAAAARDDYQQTLKIAQQLATADSHNARVQLDLSGSFDKLGDVSLRLGDTAAARDDFQQSLKIAQQLATADPHNARVQLELSGSYDQLGDVSLQLGEAAAARDDYQQSLKVAQQLAAADPHNARVQRDLSILYGNLGNVSLQLDEAAAARDYFQQSLKIAQQLAAADPHNTRVQLDLSGSFDDHGDASLRLGDDAAARDDYQQSLKILKQLADADSHNAEVLRDVSGSYQKLGDVSLRLGEDAAARDDYRQSLKIAQQLAAVDRHNAQAQRDLSLSYERLGNVSLQLDGAAAARDDYQQGLKFTLQLAAADPDNAQTKRDLSIFFDKLGNVSLQLGNAAAARDDYRNSFKIRQQLAAEPHNAAAQRDLSVSYEKLGDASLQLGDATAARDDYQQDLKIAQQLAAADPQNAQPQSDLWVPYEKLGSASQQLGDAAAAYDDYQQSLKVAQQLVAADPHNAKAQRYLLISYDKIGNASLQFGDIYAARDHYQQSLKIARQLAAEPHDVQAQTDLAYTFSRMGFAEKAAGDFAAAAKWFEQDVTILEKLDREGEIARQPLYQGRLNGGRSQLRLCTAAPHVIRDLDFALQQPSDMVPELLAIRGRALARLGQSAAADTTAEKLIALGPNEGNDLYWAVGVYAICSKNDLSKPPANGSTKSLSREEYAARAIGLLKQIEATGYFKNADNRIALEYDHNLDGLRGRDDFKKLLGRIIGSRRPKS